MNNTFYILLIGFMLIVVQNAPCQNRIEQDISRIEQKLYFYPFQGEIMIEDFLSSHNNVELKKYQGHINFLYGILAYRKAELDSAINYLEKALITFINDEDKLHQAKAELVLGWLGEGIGYWDQSKSNYYKVMDLVDEQYPRELGLAYLGIARCKYYLNEDNNTELKKGLTLLRSMRISEYTLYAEYTTSVLTKTDKQTPGRLRDIADRYVDIGLIVNAVSAYKSLATYHKDNQQYDSAHYYLNMALNLGDSNYPTTSLSPSLNQLKGLVYFLQNDYQNANSYLNKSLKLSDKHGQQATKHYAYKYLYRLDTIKGDYKSGFMHLLKYQRYKEMNHVKAKQQMAKMLEVSMNLKQVKDENDKLRLQKTVAFFLLMVILTFFVVFFWKSRNKILNGIAEKAIMQKLLVGLGGYQWLNKGMQLHNYDAEIHETIKGSEKANLYNHFKVSYAVNYKIFRSEFPQLSESEISYAIMFYVGLTDVVIAEIKNVQLDSVGKNKRRLRSKLKLEPKTDLKLYFSLNKNINR